MANRTELAERFIDTFNRRRYSADDVKDFVSENIVLSVPAAGQELHGYEGVYEYNDAWVRGFSDGRVQDDIRTVDKGEHVEIQFTGKGTFDGEFATPQGMVKGDGSRRVEVPFVNRFWFDEDNKISRVELHFEAPVLLRQMGLM